MQLFLDILAYRFYHILSSMHLHVHVCTFQLMTNLQNSIYISTYIQYVFVSYNVKYIHLSVQMKNRRYHFPTCYAYSVKEPIGELNLKRALDEDTGALLSSSSPLGQTAVSGNSTLHQ